MDGSIADSTVLRMRAQLQRMHHSSPASQTDGFLEELLKMPTTPLVEEPAAAQAAEPEVDATPTTASAQTDKDKKSSDEEPAEPSDQGDSSLPAMCIPLCYGPAPIPVPQTAEPDVSADAPAAVAEPAVLQTTVVDEQVTEPVAPTVAREVSDQVEVADIDTEIVADELAPPVESNLQPVVKDNLTKNVRDVRRAKDGRDKPEAPLDNAQSVGKPSADPKAVQSEAKKVVEPSQEQPVVQSSPVNEVDVAAQSKDIDESKSTRDGDRSQRDKWYERSVSRDETQLGPQAPTTDDNKDLPNDLPQNEAQVDAVSAQTLTDVMATATEASPVLTDASAQSILDGSQMAADMLASAQANAAQSAATQGVSETSSAANVDAARGRGSMPGSSVAVGAASATRGSAIGSAAAGSKESPDAPREITQQERVRLVQRVARSFSRLGPEGGQVTLKLHPPQLGVLNVSIKIEGQTMTARLQTETSAARDTIVDNLHLLRDRLTEQGIEIDKFQVDVGQQDMDSSSGQAGNFAGSDAHSQQSHSSAPTEIDYRRTARGNASRQNSAGAIVLEPKLQSWSAPGRSLDVRA